MNRKSIVALGRLLLAGVAGVAFVRGTVAATNLWSPAVGGNGHTYEVVVAPAGISWGRASQAAALAGGHLATITSAAENDFVFSLVDAPEFWFAKSLSIEARFGPWLGGFQPSPSPDPAAGWEWVTGEPFLFTNWHSGEPNDLGPEHFLQYFAVADITGERSAFWNDGADLRSEAIAYVIESVPEPATCLLLVLAGPAWCVARNSGSRRIRKEAEIHRARDSVHQ